MINIGGIGEAGGMAMYAPGAYPFVQPAFKGESNKNKRRLRYLRGQWMQITDRREQYKQRLADHMRYKAT